MNNHHTKTLCLPNDQFDNETLVNWYKAYQPVGSGPLSLLRVICALIEEIARVRNLTLPVPKGSETKKPIRPPQVESETTSRVREIVRQCSGAETISNKKPWRDMGMDSLHTIEIVMAVQDEFDVEISDAEAEKFTCIRDIVNFLK